MSFFAVADGDRAIALTSAQDHKRALDDDRGPNTGGMGAFSPSPLLTRDLEARVMHEIVDPVIDAMKTDGAPFRGFLYVGLMLTADGPKVIEFNVRLGDPEAQVLLPRLRVDLAELLMAAAPTAFPPATASRPAISRTSASCSRRPATPDHVHPGHPITGFDQAAALDDVLVFHGGTRKDKDRIVTAGGRVVTVVGRGADFRPRSTAPTPASAAIRFDGMQVRRDIGRKALEVCRDSSHRVRGAVAALAVLAFLDAARSPGRRRYLTSCRQRGLPRRSRQRHAPVRQTVGLDLLGDAARRAAATLQIGAPTGGTAAESAHIRPGRSDGAARPDCRGVERPACCRGASDREQRSTCGST